MKIFKSIVIAATLLALLAAPALIHAQVPAREVSEWDRLSGICRPYPDFEQPFSAAPKGYEAFYLSHLGRHGSRYQTTLQIYERPLSMLERADSLGLLTAEGREALSAVRTINDAVRGRVGDLTPVGEQEHRHIAERMYRHYPSIFKGRGVFLDVQSSERMRSTLSGVFAAERLKELNPSITVTRSASPGNWEWIFDLRQSQTIARKLKAEGWYTHAKKRSLCSPERLCRLLFTDAGGHIPEQDRWMVLYDIYNLAVDCKASGLGELDLFRFLDPEEAYPLWETDNALFYWRQCRSREFGDLAMKDAVNIVKRIISEADAAIAGHTRGANLRYGHDQNVATLASFIGLGGRSRTADSFDGIKEVFRDWETVPMACNIQMVFYRPRRGDGPVLVRFMINEEETGLDGLQPASGLFYDWDKIREALEKELNNISL